MSTAAAPAIAATAKRVLVVENHDNIRNNLVKSLRYRGFEAVGASNVAQTRALVKQLGPQFDVAVLDMRLGDKTTPHPKGVDLGHEIREAQHDLPPEFLAYTAHDNASYYDAAFALGTSAYILKENPEKVHDVLRHIRSLSLRRALSPMRDEIGNKIERIAEVKKKDRMAAVRELCLDVIKPEVDVCLAVPFILLLSEGDGRTYDLIGGLDVLEGCHAAYEQIQNLTFNNAKDGPFILRPGSVSDQNGNLLQRLENATFLPLHAEGDFRLSIGLLRQADQAFEENDTVKLGTLLNDHLPPQIGKLFKYLSRMEAAIARAERNALLDHTSRFCLYVGQTQLDVLTEAAEAKEVDTDGEFFQKLKKLALDLQATGNEFSQLTSLQTGPDAPAQKLEPVSISATVQQAWEELKDQFIVDNIKLIKRGEDFTLTIEKNDLLVAVLRVLQWMAQREEKVPTEISAPTVEVEFTRRQDRLEISFTDESRRLGDQLRQKLFEPFTQVAMTKMKPHEPTEERAGLYLPLYLAKMLIQVKNRGSFEDRTYELQSTNGHRFVMNFPVRDSNAL